MSATQLHPPVSPTEITHDPSVDGEYLMNIGGVVSLMKTGATAECRRVYRLYLADYRALEGQPLTDAMKEQKAFLAAMTRGGFKITEMEK